MLLLALNNHLQDAVHPSQPNRHILNLNNLQFNLLRNQLLLLPILNIHILPNRYQFRLK